MKDERGLYYYPDTANRQTRMYIRDNQGAIEFRMWHQDHPEIWEKHQWITLDVVKNAAAVYRGKGGDPSEIYDESIARALLKSS